MDCRLASGHKGRPWVREWERLHGPIPEGFYLRHTCGNTLCLAHMELIGYQRHSDTGHLDEEDRLRIKELAPQMRKADLAAVFGVKPWEIHHVLRQRRYEYQGSISDKVKKRAREL